MAKTIKTRIQQKHDTEANWNSAAKAATPFIPLKGELIVYDVDSTHNYERFKIGDGVTVVDLLPFAAYSRSEIDNLLQGMGSTATLNIGNGSGTGSLQQTNVQKELVDILSGSVQPTATANGATALGYATKASGKASFASGTGSEATGHGAQSLGADTLAAGYGAFATGKETKAYGFGSHTEGNATVAGDANHVYNGTSKPSNANDRIGAYAHAEGNSTTAYGEASHAEGQNTLASGYAAHAEGTADATVGDIVEASGDAAHAEGYGGLASGNYSHKEGYKSTASGGSSHAEGSETTASGVAAHAEGNTTVAGGGASHAEGTNSKALSAEAHAEGLDTEASGPRSHAEGWGTKATKDAAHAEGKFTIASGLETHAEGYGTVAGTDGEVQANSNTTAGGRFGHAEGHATKSSGHASHSEGLLTVASGNYAHAEGANTIASGAGAHAEGHVTIVEDVIIPTTASGVGSHAEGLGTTASADGAHAEGWQTSASATKSHAEGYLAQATNQAAHAEGHDTTASGFAAHAEGSGSTASGQNAHAEGKSTKAVGDGSHAEGANTEARGKRSHSEGAYTIAASDYQHVQGKFNEVDEAGTYAHIVGWGTANSNRKNIHTIDTEGNAWFAGNATIGTNKDKLATEEYVDTSVANLGKLTEQDVTDALGYTPAKKQHTHSIGQLGNLSSQLNAKMPTSGGTFTGAVSSSVDKANGTAQFRNSIVASSVPSDLSSLNVGDMIYVEGESSGGAGVTYTLSKSGSTITLTGSDGSTSSVTDSTTSGTPTYTLPAAGSSLGCVKTGGDVTISSGVITVNDDSHNHVISNIDGLQAQLDIRPDYEEVQTMINDSIYGCLVEGTLIDMADGTSKPIEEVKSGDLIKSYNPVTKELTNAVVIDAYPTGKNRRYSAYNFTDGRSLVLFGYHQFYDDVTGTTVDIRKIDSNHRLVNIDKEVDVKWAGTRWVLYHGLRKNRYNLISSNNLYFANGVLLGHKPFQKLEYVEDHRKSISDEIAKLWEQDCEDYNAVTASPADASVYRELKDAYKEYADAENQIAVHKKKLADSDYKSIKRAENLIDDEEWAVIAADRQKWRDTVNENQVKFNEQRAKINAAWRERRPAGWSDRSLFEGCFERDNAAFELVKSYFEEKNSSAE